MKKLGRLLKNQNGVALLITLIAVLIMIFMAVEIGYNTQVELKVGASQLDRLKAYYLAKSGIQISLLRINAYKVVQQRFGSQLGANKSDLDMIWSFPFAWPPILPAEAGSFDKEAVKKVMKETFIDGTFQTQIEGESGKVDINDLASPSDSLRKATNAELVQIIQNRMNVDDDWARDHENVKPQEIINNIQDWVSSSPDSVNGGSKTSGYGNGDPPVNPTNRPMKTLNELHYVKGVTDDIYNLLAPRLTVYGVKGINVNYAGAQVIQGLDKNMTAEIAQKVVDHRTDPKGGPFQGQQDFYAFLQQQGINTQTFDTNPVIPILYDSEVNFSIKSTGIYGKAQREIVAIVYDFDKVKGQLAVLVTGSPSPAAAGATPLPSPVPSPSPAANSTVAGPPPSGPPQIVYWEEF